MLNTAAISSRFMETLDDRPMNRTCSPVTRTVVSKGLP